MCFHDLGVFAGPSIFDAPTDDPLAAVSLALSDVEDAAIRYAASRDVLEGLMLLNEIEGLRRFVLVRATLARGLARRGGNGAPTLGRMLCEALHHMIGDVPSLVNSCMRGGNPSMERDTRRAIAGLNFLGSLDPDFL
jgi:hypothetical protein